MVEVAQEIPLNICHNDFGSICGEGSRKHRIDSSPTHHATESDLHGLQKRPRSESVACQNEPPSLVDSSSDDDSIQEDPDCREVSTFFTFNKFFYWWFFSYYHDSGEYLYT